MTKVASLFLGLTWGVALSLCHPAEAWAWLEPLSGLPDRDLDACKGMAEDHKRQATLINLANNNRSGATQTYLVLNPEEKDQVLVRVADYNRRYQPYSERQLDFITNCPRAGESIALWILFESTTSDPFPAGTPLPGRWEAGPGPGKSIYIDQKGYRWEFENEMTFQYIRGKPGVMGTYLLDRSETPIQVRVEKNGGLVQYVKATYKHDDKVRVYTETYNGKLLDKMEELQADPAQPLRPPTRSVRNADPCKYNSMLLSCQK